MDTTWTMYHELMQGKRSHLPARVIEKLLRTSLASDHYDIWMSILTSTDPELLDRRIHNRMRVARFKPEIVARQLELCGFVR
jgi:hypothetical protein